MNFSLTDSILLNVYVFGQNWALVSNGLSVTWSAQIMKIGDLNIEFAFYFCRILFWKQNGL